MENVRKHLRPLEPPFTTNKKQHNYVLYLLKHRYKAVVFDINKSLLHRERKRHRQFSYLLEAYYTRNDIDSSCGRWRIWMQPYVSCLLCCCVATSNRKFAFRPCSAKYSSSEPMKTKQTSSEIYGVSLFLGYGSDGVVIHTHTYSANMLWYA